MGALDNRKCVCGFRLFNEKSESAPSVVQRWLRYSSYPVGGMGSSPLGTLLGIGDPLGEYTTWAQVNTTLIETVVTAYCKACHRERATAFYFGMGVLGAYTDAGRLYIVVTDTVDAANNYVEFRGPVLLTRDLTVSPTPPLPLVVDPVITTSPDTPPRELRADSALTCLLPGTAGTYEAHLLNRRDGSDLLLGTFSV